MTVQASTVSVPDDSALRTGEQFKASLNDGRKVWVKGRLLERVTDEPALSAGIDLLASMFDDQFNPDFADALMLTFVDPPLPDPTILVGRYGI